MILRPCLGCGELVSPGPRCSRCRRQKRTRPIYGSTAWRRLSADVRSRGEGRCRWCLLPTTKLVADHVIPVTERPDLALDPTNVVSSCVSCNVRRGINAKIPVGTAK